MLVFEMVEFVFNGVIEAELPPVLFFLEPFRIADRIDFENPTTSQAIVKQSRHVGFRLFES